jgi:hypothetical protein
VAYIVADRVLDSTSTGGTGNLTVSGIAPMTYRTFSAVMANNDTALVAFVARGANQWEITRITYNTGNILVRAAGLVLAGSSGPGVLVNFSPGVVDCYIVRPAQMMADQANGNILYPEGTGIVTGNADFNIVPGAAVGDGQSSLTINGAFNNNMTVAGFGGPTFFMSQDAYVGVQSIVNSGQTGFVIAGTDVSGNNATGYFFVNASTGMQFQSPYIDATSTHCGLRFQVGESGGSNTPCLYIQPTYQITYQQPQADQSYSYQTPVTGFSITIAAGVGTLVLNPAGTLATGTITMPAAPIDGQFVLIKSTRAITALTLAANAGQVMGNGTPTTIAAGGSIQLIYMSAQTLWVT